jgi:hypothetical protein
MAEAHGEQHQVEPIVEPSPTFAPAPAQPSSMASLVSGLGNASAASLLQGARPAGGRSARPAGATIGRLARPPGPAAPPATPSQEDLALARCVEDRRTASAVEDAAEPSDARTDGRVLARQTKTKPKSGKDDKKEDKSKEPGPALQVKFGDKNLPFESKFGVDVKKEGSEKISKKLGESKQFPLSPGIVGNFGLTGEIGLEAKAEISGSVTRTDVYAPTASGSPAYFDEFTLGGTASLEAFVKGGLKVGVGVGWPGANVTGNLTGSLGASGTTSVGLKGSASRMAIPDDNVFNDWTGSISMPVELGVKLEAAVGGSIDFQILFVEGSIAEWEFGKWTIAEGAITCAASVGIPGGLVTDSAEIKDFKFNPPPALAPVRQEGSPPWGEGSGASGAGPGTAPSDELAWAGEPPDEGGTGGGPSGGGESGDAEKPGGGGGRRGGEGAGGAPAQ